MYKLTIIVLCFNNVSTIKRTVKSILKNMILESEIIIIDDGSVDGSQEILQADFEHMHNVRIIQHKKNQGTLKSRLQGIAQSRGEYIGFVDGDDFCIRGMFRSLYNGTKDSGAQIGMCSALEVGQNYWPLRRKVHVTNRVYVDQIFRRFCGLEFGSCVVWNKIYRRDLFSGLGIINDLFDWTQNHNEDAIINLVAFHKAKKVFSVSKYFYIYSRNPKGLSQSSRQIFMVTALLRACTIALRYFKDSDDVSKSLVLSFYRRQLNYSNYIVDGLSELSQNAELQNAMHNLYLESGSSFPYLIFQSAHDLYNQPEHCNE
jgi:glycosyltransferase involved in cell wall biosynthesis